MLDMNGDLMRVNVLFAVRVAGSCVSSMLYVHAANPGLVVGREALVTVKHARGSSRVRVTARGPATLI